jgi:hypothetical protein
MLAITDWFESFDESDLKLFPLFNLTVFEG